MQLDSSKIYILLCQIFVTIFVQSQSFYNVVGSSGNDYARSIVVDRDSGYVVVGATEGLGQGLMDGYLLKFDTAGMIQYTRTFGGEEIDWLTDIKVIPTGYILCGYSNSFGLDYDAYVIQTDLNGIPIWEKTIGGDQWDFANSIALTPDGNYIIAGESYSFSNGASDGFVAKINSLGDTLWTKHFGGVDRDFFNEVAVNSLGEIALCGLITKSSVDTDFWVVKLDSQGDLLWEKQLGDTLNDEGRGIVFMSSGDLVAIGKNTFPTTQNGVAGYYYKFDPSGTILFEEGFFGPNDDFGEDVTHYPSTDNVIAVMNTQSYGFGASDVFVAELDAILLPTNQQRYSFGTYTNDIPESVDTTWDRGVVVVGTTSLSQFGAQSIFIHKTDSTSQNIEVYTESVDLKAGNEISGITLKFGPNPTSGLVNFNQTLINKNYSITDFQGRIVQSGLQNGSYLFINATQGVYLLQIDGFVPVKVVKY